jgi:hypothetical protein
LVGTLPENGTICTTDHSGLNNEFLVYPLNDPFLYIQAHAGRDIKLIAGLALGLGFPVLVGGIIVYGFWRIRRTGAKRQEAKARIEHLRNNTRITA